MRKQWKQEEIRLLTELAAAGKPTAEIARRLDRSEEAIRVYVKKHGIRRTGCNTTWSPAEEHRFAADWLDGTVSRTALQRRYRRSWSALKQRAQKLRLGPRPVSDLYVTKGELTAALGISEKRLKRWVRQSLPAHKSKTNRVYGAIFDQDELLRFLELHRDEFDGRNVDERFFYREPDWLQTKRRQDYAGARGHKNEPWTDGDDTKLTMLFQQGMSDPALSQMLERSHSSIRSRRFVLGLNRKHRASPAEHA